MPPLDPLRRAEILFRFGRETEAVRVLRDALASEPNRVGIRSKLEEFTRHGSSSTLVGTVHLCMSWVFLFGPLLALVPVSPWLRSAADSFDGHELGAIAAVALGLALATVWLAVAGYVFLHLWFMYLKYVVGSYRPEVERRLPGFVAVERFQPLYGNMRSVYFRGDA
jgi:hypothetical protein